MNRTMTSLVSMGLGAFAYYLFQNSNRNRTGRFMRRLGRRMNRAFS